MHPDGDELLYLIEGNLDVSLDATGGGQQTVSLTSGDAFVVHGQEFGTTFDGQRAMSLALPHTREEQSSVADRRHPELPIGSLNRNADTRPNGRTSAWRLMQSNLPVA